MNIGKTTVHFAKGINFDFLKSLHTRDLFLHIITSEESL